MKDVVKKENQLKVKDVRRTQKSKKAEKKKVKDKNAKKTKSTSRKALRKAVFRALDKKKGSAGSGDGTDYSQKPAAETLEKKDKPTDSQVSLRLFSFLSARYGTMFAKSSITIRSEIIDSHESVIKILRAERQQRG